MCQVENGSFTPNVYLFRDAMPRDVSLIATLGNECETFEPKAFVLPNEISTTKAYYSQGKRN